jgi:peptidyl-prolyl cis-trans isomerase A (cyclophilin A)
MRTRGWLLAAGWVMGCATPGAGGGATEPPPPVPAADAATTSTEPAAVVEPDAVATTPEEPCAALATVLCEVQDLEGEGCTALAARVAERGVGYCTNRLPDARAQVAISQGLLAEELPAGAEVPERTSCAEAERTLEPATPDPEGGQFTLEEALAGLAGEGNPRARIITRLGTLDCVLFADKAPLTVANFVGLARGVRPWWDPCRKEWRHGPYYDGLLFHRVIPGFMIQGGDILGNGEGDAGYEIPDEFDPALRHDAPGILSMANSGPNTGGAQFFVTEGPTRWLNDKHSVFGRCEHAGVVARIAREPRDESDRLRTPVVMKIEIYR